MVTTAEQNALGNYAYTYMVDDYICTIHQIDPGFNLRPLFDDAIIFGGQPARG